MLCCRYWFIQYNFFMECIVCWRRWLSRQQFIRWIAHQFEIPMLLMCNTKFIVVFAYEFLYHYSELDLKMNSEQWTYVTSYIKSMTTTILEIALGLFLEHNSLEKTAFPVWDADKAANGRRRKYEEKTFIWWIFFTECMYSQVLYLFGRDHSQ